MKNYFSSDNLTEYQQHYNEENYGGAGRQGPSDQMVRPRCRWGTGRFEVAAYNL